MAYKDPDKAKKYYQERYQKNKETKKAKSKEQYQKNKEQISEQNSKCTKNRNQHAYDSITSGKIIDQNMWDKWCNEIKKNAAKAKYNYPYSDDFTNDVMFEMMVQGCFSCGDVSTTIDRIDSKLKHTPKNCVGSCIGCNKSKGAADPDTFIRKAYYRARGEYHDDDTNIWFVHKQKPNIWNYKHKKVPFELTKDEWDKLVVGECAYCHRSPTTWFGVDRIDPSKGYVLGNVASCCFDCNLDKLDDDVETMRARNERIAQRMDAGELVIGDHEKVILHAGKKSSKTVCANGNVYESQSVAATSINKCLKTVINRISDGKDPKIFAVTKEFYDFAIENNLENITKDMFDYFMMEQQMEQQMGQQMEQQMEQLEEACLEFPNQLD